ncbi:MAG: PDZ domain-containing protein [Candidatus Omnitrophica bacterium]|nr:PDZ domain-containing protein [Candidatus Omnitrophota bacterium]
MTLLVAILIFSVLVMVHEYSHFIVARFSGVKVEKFSIGFGPPLFQFKKGDTLFLVCAVPLGGYVKLAGDNKDEARGTPEEFLSKSPGIKSRIVAAGPIGNYLLAGVLFCLIAFIGYPKADVSSEPVIGSLEEGYPAAEAGLREGDRILAVDETEVDDWEHMAELIHAAQQRVTVSYQRGENTFTSTVPLKTKVLRDEYGRKLEEVSIMGIAPQVNTETVRYGFPGALLKGGELWIKLTARVARSFWYILTGSISFREGAGGPLAIVYYTAQFTKMGVVQVLNFAAALNISLAIINLLPVPVLDGGHLAVFGLERIRRKPLSERAEGILMKIGIGLILLLVLTVSYNDIVKYGPKYWDKIMTLKQRVLPSLRNEIPEAGQ